jgi:hypothetical protein
MKRMKTLKKYFNRKLKISELLPKLKPGDILQIRDPTMDFVWKMDYWCHTMMYIGKNKDGVHELIHSCGNGVEIIPLRSKLDNENITNWTALRVKGTPDINKVIRFAKSKIDQPFDMWSLYHITKQIEPTEEHFGYGYYCTELVWAAYKKTGVDIDPNRFGWITDWEVYSSKQIERIYIKHAIIPMIWRFLHLLLKSNKHNRSFQGKKLTEKSDSHTPEKLAKSQDFNLELSTGEDD